jgi:hypothetical protein
MSQQRLKSQHTLKHSAMRPRPPSRLRKTDAGQAAAVVARLRQDGAEFEFKLEDDRESRE